MRAHVVGLLVAVLLVGGCAGRGSGNAEPASGSDGGESGVEANPADLIGTWTLTEMAEPGDSAIQFELNGVYVWRTCGVVDGSWRANSYGQFVAYVFAQSEGDCGTVEQWHPEWLYQVTAFRADGDARLLLGAEGELIARLLPGAEPTPNRYVPDPVPSEEVQRAFAPAVPLPPGLQPAEHGTLVGRWVAGDDSTHRPDIPHLELAGDGTWSGTDGCNGQGGRWRAGPDGAVLAVIGVVTAMGCDNILVGDWLVEAARAGLDGDVLVLLDNEGHELGRLLRD